MRRVGVKGFWPVPGLLILASCLELEQTVVVRADGSGVQRLRVGMTPAVLDAVERAAPAVSPPGSAGALSVFERELVAGELRQRGLELLSHRTWSERRHRFVELEAEFGSIAALQSSPLAGSKAEWVVLPGTGKWEGKLRLILYPQGRLAWQRARAQPAQDDPLAQSLFERRSREMKGLDVALHIEVPGDVVWTHNMERSGPRKATVRIRDTDLDSPEALARILAPRYEVIFDGRGCSW